MSIAGSGARTTLPADSASLGPISRGGGSGQVGKEIISTRPPAIQTKERPSMKMIHVGDLHMHVVDRGQGGIPVLFVHGFPLDHTMWNPQLDEFAVHGRVIAPDLRGFGKTGVTPGVATMEQHADDLAGLL